jgi:ABC-2 type transport system ATP-binding protein
VDLSVAAGTIFCLLGSNGAGKTTLIRILTTLLSQTSGTAYVFDLDTSRDAAEVRKIISLTGQFAAVDELLTARENIELTAHLFHIQGAKQRATSLLEAFNLTQYADQKVSTFSGGMRRRLDIAMSLSGDPRIIFLDEPTTGLDPQSRIEMWDIIRRLVTSGITVFLTTQYLDEAERLADRIAILQDGRISHEGTPAELKTLVQGAKIVLSFDNPDEMQRAERRLQDPTITRQALTLSVTTDGTVSALSHLLSQLDGIDVLTVEQQKPSLEDAFLALINERK